jgi:hypothetical protein
VSDDNTQNGEKPQTELQLARAFLAEAVKWGTVDGNHEPKIEGALKWANSYALVSLAASVKALAINSGKASS